MFHKELSAFLNLPKGSRQPELLIDTKNWYEFTMAGCRVDSKWYALVDGADSGRIDDISEVIEEEFDATVEGWCVLKKYHEKLGIDVIPFTEADRNYHFIADGNYWLLKIKPIPDGRLDKLKDTKD